MTKDEALDLALEALGMYQAAGFGNSTDFNKQHEAFYKAQTAITAIKQAHALDKKAENARELGMDYEPAEGTQVSKVWWDGEKLMAKPIPLVDFYQPVQDSTCNETLRAQDKAYPRTCRKCGLGPCIGAPAAPVQEPVASLSELQKDAANLLFALHDAWPYVHGQCTIESKRKAIQALIVKHGEFADLHPPAQPAVPDALTSADIQEHIEYVAGWNDCRQAMLEMMK
jgi:hypothetical protein